MFAMQIKVLGLAVAGALLAMAPAASAAPAREAAPTAQKAVAVLLDSLSTPGTFNGTCNTLTGQVTSCPITARLLDRLQHPAPAENGNIVSRSQNPPRSLSYKEVDNDGKTAHIDSTWQYGAGSAYSITFVAVNTSAGWQVDDSYCTGMPNTSIYNTPVGPCQAVATPGVPGLPNTGVPSAGLAFAILGAGMLLMLAGYFLSTQGRNTGSR